MSERPEDPLKPLSAKERKNREKQRQKNFIDSMGHTNYGPTSLPIMESFRWLTKDIFKVQEAGEHTIMVKGVALRSNTISKNRRKYVEKELLERGATLTSKPFDVNHNPRNRIGHVEWAQYEDGALEYLVKVKNPQYVNMIRNRDPRIRGVSVSAHYLFNRCPECGEKFLSEEDWQYHMEKVHLRKDLAREVHGLVFDGLSLVVAPEEPGVEDTTLEIYETSPGCNRLFEIISKEKGFKMTTKIRKRSNKQLCEEFGLTMQRLGEPFLDYDNIDDCIAKNPDKEDPTAWCATLMRKTEEQGDVPLDSHGCRVGEEVWSEAENKCVPLSVEEKARFASILDMAKKQYEAEDIKPGSHWCEEHPDDPRCKAHKKAIHGDLEETFNEWIGGANKTIKHYGECIDDLQKQVDVLKQPKSLTETMALTEKVNKLQVDVDNLDAHLKKLSVFKGHQKPVEETTPREHVEDPMKKR